MKVTVLGSGTAVPREDRFPAGYLVQSEGYNVLVDLGPGVLRQLPRIGLDLDRIHAVLLTHYHTDHCADLAGLLFGLRNPRYAGRDPLRILGHPGLEELLSHLEAAWRWLKPEGYERRVEEIGPGRHQVGPFAVQALRIEHTDQSLGYRFEDPDGTVAAFSGDAVACPALAELAREADLFVCDSAFPDAAPGPGHMTPREAGEAAAAARARTLCLTHFYPECDGHDLAGSARAVFDGRVVLAEDLMVFALP